MQSTKRKQRRWPLVLCAITTGTTIAILATNFSVGLTQTNVDVDSVGVERAELGDFATERRRTFGVGRAGVDAVAVGGEAQAGAAIREAGAGRADRIVAVGRDDAGLHEVR